MMNQPLSRDIVISGEIDERSAGRVIAIINEINNEDDENEREMRNYKRTAIKLWINSGGGSVYDALGIIDAIGFSITPVATFCFGKAMSAAFWIYLAGIKRVAGKNCTFMYHEISTMMWDKLEGFKKEVKEMQRLQDMCDSFIKENTKITQEQMDHYKTTKSEWYIGAQEAFNLGICDIIAETVYNRNNVQTSPKKFKIKDKGALKLQDARS